MKRLAFAASFVLGFFCLIASSFALSIDEFDDFGKAEVPFETPNSASKNIVSSSAIGGNRVLYITRTGPSPFNGGSTEIYSNTRLFHNQGSDVRALSRVTWDKDSSADNPIIAGGLGPIDFTQDGGSAIQMNITFDYGTSEPLDVTLRLYDANDPSGNTFSEVAFTLNQVLNNFNLNIPFSDFKTLGAKNLVGPGGTTFSAFTFFPSGRSVNFSRVGAVVLEINGQNGDSDLSLGFIKTNGLCNVTPDQDGDVIDECGVCKGQPNYKMPKDVCGVCAGQPNYNLPKDACGFCAGDPNYNVPKDSCNVCPGQPLYNIPKDSCGVCPADPKYNLPKDDCNNCFGTPNYENSKDPCGKCFGDGSSCADCSGTPNGTDKIDICNVCAGNGTTCLDCSGTPFGTKGLDGCNVCGGDGKSCLDCAGVPFGSSKLDACGTCGGKATDPNNCFNIQCVTVKASSEILAFEKRLVNQTKTITKKFREEDKRNVKNKCGINTKPSSKRVETAYNTITKAGKEIFNKGVEICGDACVTVSFADQVLALSPQLSLIEKETSSLAKKVQACYKRKGIKTTQSINGVATTIKNVKSDLKQLVKDCKDKLVCR